MTGDVRAKVREYTEYFISTVADIELDEIVERASRQRPGQPVGRLRPKRRTPGWVYAVAAAVGVLLVVGGVAWLTGADRETPPAISPEPTTVATDAVTPTNPSTPANPSPTFEGWTRLDTEAFIGTVPRQVVPFGSGFVVVGAPGECTASGEDGRPPCRMATWYSPDGDEWQRTDLDAEPLEGIVLDLASTDSLVVAVGFRVGPDFHRSAAVWITADGVHWEEVQSEAFSPELDVWLLGVAAGGPGFVAVGTITTTDPDTQRQTPDGAVWVSANGLDWERVDDESGVFEGKTIGSVELTTLGLFAAGGPEPTVWHSHNGTTWQAASLPIGQGHDHVAELFIVEANGNIFAVASQGGGAWTSSDGATWTAVSIYRQTPTIIHDVAVSDGTLIAVGSDRDWEGEHPAVWTSVDALTWQPLGWIEGLFDDSGVITGLTASDTDAIAVGFFWAAGDPATNEPGTTIGTVWRWHR